MSSCRRLAGLQPTDVAEPKLHRLGNLRLACLAGVGFPADPLTVARAVRSLVELQDIHPTGPALVVIATAANAEPPAQWECHTGLAVTGMPRPVPVAGSGQLLVEDYRQLVALTAPHPGPVRDLGRTWTMLAEHARGLGHRLRPYWWVALRRRRLADGNLLPAAEVSVFLDQ